MEFCRNVGGVAALGVGIGAAFAASMGAVGYLLGVLAAVALTIGGKAVSTRHP